MKQKQRILLITHYYPPLNKVGSSRAYSWAKYWSMLDHEVFVLTTKKSDREAPLNYRPVEEYSSGIIVKELEDNFGAPFGKLIVHEHNAKSNRVQWFRQEEFANFRKKISDIRSSFITLPSLKLWWIHPASLYAEKLYESCPYDIVVSTFAPVASHLIASKIKQKKNIFWVADYRDLWSGYSYFSPRGPLSIFSKIIERHYLRNVDLITTVSDPLKNELTRLLDKPALTFENGFDPEEFIFQGKSHFPKDDKVRIVYSGTIFPEKQDPSPLFDAIISLKGSNKLSIKRLQVLFYGPKTPYLERLIKKYNLSESVFSCGFVDRNTSIQIQREADALLFLEWNEPRESGVFTGKIFEYLFSGTPIMSIGAFSSNSANSIIKKSKTGVVLNRSVKNIKAFLIKLLKGERISYNPSLEILNKYHKKNLAEKLLNEILKRKQIST
jgi:hypothetical protein